MFEQCQDVVKHFEEIQAELSSPDVALDQNRFRKLMKEQSDLEDIVSTYRGYLKAQRDQEDALQMLEEEKDEEMRQLLKDELSDARKRTEQLSHTLKVLLLPKDPNDEKNRL